MDVGGSSGVLICVKFIIIASDVSCILESATVRLPSGFVESNGLM